MKNKNMKLFYKSIFNYVICISFIVIVFVYVFVCINLNKKTTKIEQNNFQKEEALAVLIEHNSQLEKLEKDVNEIQVEVKNIIDQFPADMREEDAIMLAVDMQQDNKMKFNALEISQSEPIFKIPNKHVLDGFEKYDQTLLMKKKRVVYSNSTNYEDLKKAIEIILQKDNKISIESISYVRNNDARILEGSIEVDLFSLYGTDKVYQYPDIATYEANNKDIFLLKGMINNEAAQ